MLAHSRKKTAIAETDPVRLHNLMVMDANARSKQRLGHHLPFAVPNFVTTHIEALFAVASIRCIKNVPSARDHQH
jgi:hypothetical protein